MVLSQVNLKLNPEHPTLAGYLSDNPSPLCPLVGLEHISEYWGGGGVGKGRPYYHCSLGECYNEQGNSRQMMQHLVRRHHVEGWLKEREGRLPNTYQEVVIRCRQLFNSGDIKCDVKMIKVIISEELWWKCKKARLRLTKRQAEELYKQGTQKKVVEKLPGANMKPAETIDHGVGEPLLGTTQSMTPCSSPQTIATASQELGEAVHSIQDVSPIEVAEAIIDNTSEKLVGLLLQEVVDPTPVAEVVANTVVTNNAISSSTENDVFSTLSLSDNNPDNVASVDTIENTAVVEVFKNENITTSSEPALCITSDSCSNITASVEPDPPVHLSVAEVSQSVSQSDTIKIPPEVDLTGQTQKKLSLKEYQEKLKEKRGSSDQQDVKPFEEDDEIEVVGFKEGNAKASKSDFVSSPSVKKEKSSGTQPKDLLERRSSGDVLVECAVKAPIQPQLTPMYIFKLRVTDRVKRHLLNYYAKDANDTKDKHGNLKVIKIKNNKEFESYCKSFSKKFQAGIYEAYTSINGSEEGIEHVDVNQYGIDHDIEKFFSDILPYPSLAT